MIINIPFLHFRFRQVFKIACALPIIYLVILFIMLAFGSIYLAGVIKQGWYHSLLVGLLWMSGLLYYHIRRKDYHFVCWVEEYPVKVFGVDYFLVSLPLLICLFLQGSQWVGVGVGLITPLIGCIKQPVSKFCKGYPIPSFIPFRAFEVRSGIRKNGLAFLFVYIGAGLSLFVPYLSLFLLWLYTGFFVSSFTYAEPVPILCSAELPFRAFIWQKIRMNVTLYFITMLPICILYIIFYPEHGWFVGLFVFLAVFNVCLGILAKYAFYRPGKMVGNKMIVSLSLIGILFPVLAPVTIFFLVRYYSMARQILTPYLYAYN